MPLPERQHLYLEEARERLGLSQYDLWYYLGQGLLNAEVWVEHRCLYSELLNRDDPYNGWATMFADFYRGYLIVPPMYCHRLAAVKETGVERFYHGDPSSHRTPCVRRDEEEETLPITVHRDMLLIRKTELQRFAKQYDLRMDDRTDAEASPGRPSIMSDILAEHRRLLRLRLACTNNSREAKALRDWAAARFTSDMLPTQKTICNQLSALHQQWRKVRADAGSGDKSQQSDTVAV